MKFFIPLFSCFIFVSSASCFSASQGSNDSDISGEPLLNVAAEENSPLLCDQSKREEDDSDGSWTEDAEYVAAIITSLVTVAASFKYGGRYCYREREGYERMHDPRDFEERGRSLSSESNSANLSNRGTFSEVRPQQNDQSTSPNKVTVSAETREKCFQDEVQTFINKEICPRTQMVERLLPQTTNSFHHIQLADSFQSRVALVRGQSEKFVSFFKNNFENIFQYKQKTKVLENLIEPHISELEGAKNNPTTSTIIQRTISNLAGDSLASKHASVIEAARKYCSDFDDSWEKAVTATQQQYQIFNDLQLKLEWLNATFPEYVQTIEQEINQRLENGDIGEPVTLRSGAIKDFFQKTHQERFVNDQKKIRGLNQMAKEKFCDWHRQLEELCFWGETEEAAKATAQERMSLTDEETSLLLKRCNGWKEEALHAITRAENYYDAVHHNFPTLEADSTITKGQRDLVIKAVEDVNNQYAINSSSYPLEYYEQKYLEEWVESQYKKIVEMLKAGRSYFSTRTYISRLNETFSGKEEFSEDEKKVLRYFLNVVESSRIDFISKKAALLSANLDPLSDDSEDGF